MRLKRSIILLMGEGGFSLHPRPGMKAAAKPVVGAPFGGSNPLMNLNLPPKERLPTARSGVSLGPPKNKKHPVFHDYH